MLSTINYDRSSPNYYNVKHLSKKSKLKKNANFIPNTKRYAKDQMKKNFEGMRNGIRGRVNY